MHLLRSDSVPKTHHGHNAGRGGDIMTPHQKSVFFKGVAGLHQNQKHGLFCAFVLAPGLFLTFGKVYPSPRQTDIFFGMEGVPSHLPPHFCQRRPLPSD